MSFSRILNSVFIVCVIVMTSCKPKSHESELDAGFQDNILNNLGLKATTNLTFMDVGLEPMIWADKNEAIPPSRQNLYTNLAEGLQRAWRGMPPYANSKFIGLIDDGNNLHAVASYRYLSPDKVELDFLVARPPGTDVQKKPLAGLTLMAEIMRRDENLKSMSLVAATQELLGYYRNIGFKQTRNLNMEVDRNKLMGAYLTKVRALHTRSPIKADINPNVSTPIEPIKEQKVVSAVDEAVRLSKSQPPSMRAKMIVLKGFGALGAAAGLVPDIVQAALDKDASDAQRAKVATSSVPVVAGVTAAVAAKEAGKSDAEAAAAFFLNILGMDLGVLGGRCADSKEQADRFAGRFGRRPNTPNCQFK